MLHKGMPGKSAGHAFKNSQADLGKLPALQHKKAAEDKEPIYRSITQRDLSLGEFEDWIVTIVAHVHRGAVRINDKRGE